jgi:hypothetical protein
MFLIRETETGAFCTGQHFRSFSMDMQSAAQFVSRANAEKAIKGMFRGDRNGQQYNIWTIDDKRYHPNVQAYIDQCTKTNAIEMADAVRDTYIQKICVMEVVEVKLILVDE